MSYENRNFNNDFNAPTDLFAAAADADTRSAFITKTYLYLTGAILALIAIEVILFNTVDVQKLSVALFANGIGGAMVPFLLFIGVSWLANYWALNSTSSLMQHAGLALYVVAMAVIIMPLLCVAFMRGETEGWRIIQSAGLATGGLFSLLTLAVFITKKDFSFLGSFLWFASLAAIGFIAVSFLFSFDPGVIFLYAIIALMCLYILYDTSNIMYHYRVDQHVAASLALFASVATLFVYILRLFLSSRD